MIKKPKLQRQTNNTLKKHPKCAHTRKSCRLRFTQIYRVDLVLTKVQCLRTPCITLVSAFASCKSARISPSSIQNLASSTCMGSSSGASPSHGSRNRWRSPVTVRNSLTYCRNSQSSSCPHKEATRVPISSAATDSEVGNLPPQTSGILDRYNTLASLSNSRFSLTL